MYWILLQASKENNSYSFSPPPPPPPFINLENKISPSILLIIVTIAVIFFISGLLHLLVRYLFRPTNREPEQLDNVTALQGQLQQLFHLHDSGVDQSFIDTLPIFLYKTIIDLKDPFDCAVCLCEFEPNDKLRLLPKCSHAFHIECIDTWLLSHSTCPLCRSSLLPDFSPSHSCSPVVLVLESGSESSREIGLDRGELGPNSHLSFLGEENFGPPVIDNSQKPAEVVAKDENSLANFNVSDTKVVHVKLGKFRNVGNTGSGGEGSSNGNINQRRCFSMGSFEYVMNESSLLQVAIKPPKKKPSSKKPGHRLAMSECDCHSRRDLKGFDPSRGSVSKHHGVSASIGADLQKNESFSISKIWLRSKKENSITEDNSRRAFSFRFSLHQTASDESKMKSRTSPRTVSELDDGDWEKSGSESGLDVEVGSCSRSIGSRIEESPSFTRRTLLWIMGTGRQKKVVSHV